MKKVYNPMTNMLEPSKKPMVKDAGWSQVKTIKRMVYEDVEDMLNEKDIKIAKNNGWLKGDKIIIPAGQKAKVKGQQIVFEKGGLDLDFYDTTSFEVIDSKMKDSSQAEIKTKIERAILRYDSKCKIKRWYTHSTSLVAVLDLKDSVGRFDELHFTKALKRALDIPGIKTIYMDGLDLVFEFKNKIGDSKL